MLPPRSCSRLSLPSVVMTSIGLMQTDFCTPLNLEMGNGWHFPLSVEAQFHVQLTAQLAVHSWLLVNACMHIQRISLKVVHPGKCMHVWCISLDVPLLCSGTCAIHACVGNYRSLSCQSVCCIEPFTYIFNAACHCSFPGTGKHQTFYTSAWDLIDPWMATLPYFCTLQIVFIKWMLMFLLCRMPAWWRACIFWIPPECTGLLLNSALI